MNKMKKNKKVACVYVDKVEEYRTDYRIYYSIMLGGNYEDHFCLMPQNMVDDKKNIIKRYFPIVYDSTNFDFRMLIINKEQLLEWDLSEDVWERCQNKK